MRACKEEAAARQADVAVDRLLVGLRENMPGDLEARLLGRLKAASKSGRAGRRWPFLQSHLALLGGAAAIAGVVLAVTLSQRSPSGRPAVAEQPALPRMDSRAAVVRGTGPATRGETIGRAETRRPEPLPVAASAAELREQAMWDDFRAPTQVAPPIPLTPEERKMHRLILDARAPQVASLDPIFAEMEADRVNAAREHAAAEYEGFFRQPPPPPELPPDSSDSSTPSVSSEPKGTQP